MSSVTTWNRLEPLPRTDQIQPSLQASIADPLWLLGRQWQLSELQAEDAGFPIRLQLRAESARISRYHPGPLRGPAAEAAARSLDHDDAVLPLEALVEREAVAREAANERLAGEAGLHFLRLLDAQRMGRHRQAYVDRYGFPRPAVPAVDPASTRLRQLYAGRVPDGFRLRADLVDHRGAADSLTSLPAEPAIPPGQHNRVLAAANAWLDWWDQLYTEPSGDDAWRPSRLEYAFAVQATSAAGPVVLRADEYHGGRLDWYHFDAAAQPALGDPATPVPPETVVRTVMPTPVTYGGMPADRFWEVEDATVAFGGLATGRTDLARLLLAEFGLAYGNDWFVVPVDLPLGSICSIDTVEVTDTFGEVTEVPRAGADEAWTMFELTVRGPDRLRHLLFLPPVLAGADESEPLEEVALFRDEMANLVWGVERRVQGPSGRPFDRYEEHQRQLAATESQSLTGGLGGTGDVGTAELVYRLQTFVPDHWCPFVPVPAPGTRPVDAVTQLERRSLIRIAAGGTTRIVEPRGVLLQLGDPPRAEEEEIPRAGLVLRRSWQLARWTDGRTVLWVGRSKRVGRGEGASGLRFDLASPP